MHKFRWLGLLAIVMIATFALYSCEELEDKVNEATAKTENFKQDLKPGIPVKGVGGACTPTAISFDSLLSAVPLWSDVKEHIEEVNINELLYTVDPNKSTGNGKIDIYVTDSGDYFSDDQGAPPDSDRIGSTDTIEVGETYKDEDIVYASGGKTALEDLMMDFEESFHICAGWDGNEDEVDLTFLLTIDVDVVFVPL